MGKRAFSVDTNAVTTAARTALLLQLCMNFPALSASGGGPGWDTDLSRFAPGQATLRQSHPRRAPRQMRARRPCSPSPGTCSISQDQPSLRRSTSHGPQSPSCWVERRMEGEVTQDKERRGPGAGKDSTLRQQACTSENRRSCRGAEALHIFITLPGIPQIPP